MKYQLWGAFKGMQSAGRKYNLLKIYKLQVHALDKDPTFCRSYDPWLSSLPWLPWVPHPYFCSWFTQTILYACSLSALGAARNKAEFLAASHLAGKASSPLPFHFCFWKKSQTKISFNLELWRLCEKEMQVKWNFNFFPSFASMLRYFAAMECGDLSPSLLASCALCQNWYFYKRQRLNTYSTSA